MKLSGHMEETKISYKAVDPRCNINVRELNRHKAARRLITNNKRKVSSAGLVVQAPSDIAAGALVEIDLSFPGIPLIYRSRGVVDWLDTAAGKIGVLVFGMDKVDPNAIPEPEAPLPQEPIPEELPPPQQAPAMEPEAPPQAPEPMPQPVESQPTVAQQALKEKIPGMQMPDDEDVAELFSGLVDADVDVSINDDKPIKSKRFAVVGEYQNDSGAPVLLMVADVALVNFLGSALVMLPKDEAENANKNGTISDEIQESFQEICNISSSLINDAGNQHVRFEKMYVVKNQALPNSITQIIDNHSAKTDFTVSIPGYGSGRLALIDATWK
ncbi:MAG: hypothetical protein JXX29_03550 [Deltaproteobacteria bacterium]|nr:hypothetical protein [Deltaproteobacteria bacterium]MBN2670718.1 hypothetical protein [Deltaproteobacteria bacterium]